MSGCCCCCCCGVAMAQPAAAGPPALASRLSFLSLAAAAEPLRSRSQTRRRNRVDTRVREQRSMAARGREGEHAVECGHDCNGGATSSAQRAAQSRPMMGQPNAARPRIASSACRHCSHSICDHATCAAPRLFARSTSRLGRPRSGLFESRWIGDAAAAKGQQWTGAHKRSCGD